ncbi:MAG: hypothetical protein QNJ49_22350 [Mastigocoleus sp. MO_167.B18]|uniref:S8 family serine peptidase n=1 Tax=Mastigocoleus sp. MO_188.B34 TaxID=3036635 RepID=UPI00261237B1|nr:hypothetical protein [Mastigocoleus sp. MO_188.B34]MDJ0694976.1 hypothetical protein [Mastigocoleus sp. MO_188.B34]MDJ0776132.1 hypothetical protein [Mastigocoleus sp. MO_167.B18]
MKLLFSGIVIFSGLMLADIEPLKAQVPNSLPNQTDSKLFYSYYGRKIPLALQGDIFAPRRLATSSEEEYLEQKNYINENLPALPNRYRNQDKVTLSNEIIVSFDEGLSQSSQKSILRKYQLKIVRKLRFSKNRYIVTSKSTLGTGILDIANQLDRERGVKSASPNFALHY